MRGSFKVGHQKKVSWSYYTWTNNGLQQSASQQKASNNILQHKLGYISATSQLEAQWDPQHKKENTFQPIHSWHCY